MAVRVPASGARSPGLQVESGAASRPADAKPIPSLPLVRSKLRIPAPSGLARERLDRLIDRVWEHPFTLVVAPAGSGKTTLLSRWAAAAQAGGAPVAWYRADATDATAAAFLGYVRLAIDEALAREPGRAHGRRAAESPWRSADEAAASLESRLTDRVLLVVDDLHTLAGSEAESTLERLVDLAPPALVTVAGTRSVPDLNVARRFLSGELFEITAEDLRFRSWEVERLFDDVYGEALNGGELGRLARQTEGWAAGLQLFHLATRGKSPVERAHFLKSLVGSTRLVREYLARNVLDELPGELRDFLARTGPLRRLSGPLCDVYLGRSGSSRLLEELERRQVFTVSLDDGTYRYHEVLQSHLDQLLIETEGEARAREASARAAELLEERGAIAEALVAWCRADRWDDAARVLGADGARLRVGPSDDWLAEVAPAVVRNDPWLRLGSARRLRAEGHWERAMGAFAEAEAGFGSADQASVCRTERRALGCFLDSAPQPTTHWSGSLRAVVHRNPLGRRSSGVPRSGTEAAATDRLVAGLASLAAGFVLNARSEFGGAAADPGTDPAIAAAATIGMGVTGALAGYRGSAAELEQGVGMAERAGAGWLARLGRACLVAFEPSFGAGGQAELRTLREAAARDGDRWGEVLFALVEGLAALERPGTALASFELAERGARRLGAGTLEAWARGLAALAAARLGLPDAPGRIARAEGQAHAHGVYGVSLPIYLALAASDSDRAADHLELAEAVRRDTGLFPPAWFEKVAEPLAQAAPDAGADQPATGSPPVAVPASSEDQAAAELASVEIRLMGGFAMSIGGRPVNLAAIKPRPRALLRLLALNAGQPVHREVLTATFWPEADPATAARNVHVALTGLRKELCAGPGREWAGLVREGDAYRLLTPPGSWVDLIAIGDSLAEARAAHSHADRDGQAAACRRALSIAGGELLPEDGPADWVVYRREELKAELAGAARTLAELTIDTDPDGAAEACLAGLRLDRSHDGLWRLLIAARERAGDTAAASTARQAYARMLEQLGLTSASER